MIASEASISGTPQPQRQIVKGLWGWLMRMNWRRRARQMSRVDVDELRKRLVIINRQLQELPISSRVFKRRMELLRDRERCNTIIAAWEAYEVTDHTRNG